MHFITHRAIMPKKSHKTATKKRTARKAVLPARFRSDSESSDYEDLPHDKPPTTPAPTLTTTAPTLTTTPDSQTAAQTSTSPAPTDATATDATNTSAPAASDHPQTSTALTTSPDGQTTTSPDGQTASNNIDMTAGLNTILSRLDAIHADHQTLKDRVEQVASVPPRKHERHSRSRKCDKTARSKRRDQKSRSKSRKASSTSRQSKRKRSPSGSPTGTDTDSDTGKSSENSSEYDNFSDEELFSSSGHCVGDTVSDTMRDRILQGKFIELSDLMPKYGIVQTAEFSLKAGPNKGTTFVRNKDRRNLPFHQWQEAFDIYIAVHIDRATSLDQARKLTRELLTYRRNITHMKNKGEDWTSYDRHYRRDQASMPIPWSKFRDDLHRMYCQTNSNRYSSYTGNQQQPFRTSQPKSFGSQTKPSSSMPTPDGNSIPLGYCLDFHTSGKSCSAGNACKYAHKCPRCQARHPIFRSCQMEF